MYNRHVQLVPLGSVRNQKGTSLTDVLVATALGLITVTSALGFYRYQLFAFRHQSAQVEVQTAARAVLNLVISELRRAAGNPRCVPNFEGIAEASASRIRIRSDLDGNGATDSSGEDVTYAFDSAAGRLTRTTAGVTEELSDSNFAATGFQLRYFDGSGAELVPSASGLTQAQRAAVRRISVALTLSRRAIDPRNNQSLSATVSSSADLRNRFLVSVVSCS